MARNMASNGAEFHALVVEPFPGCATAGADLDAVPAEEALAFHVEGLTEEGEPLPEPSTLEAVMSELANRDGVAILVPLADGPVKTVRPPCRKTPCGRSTPMRRRRGSRGRGSC
jgi:predicted RNase H-like HicB family nuclease